MKTPRKNHKDWFRLARRLARLLDEALTVPELALESKEWSSEADAAIVLAGLKPESSTKKALCRRIRALRR